MSSSPAQQPQNQRHTHFTKQLVMTSVGGTLNQGVDFLRFVDFGGVFVGFLAVLAQIIVAGLLGGSLFDLSTFL